MTILVRQDPAARDTIRSLDRLEGRDLQGAASYKVKYAHRPFSTWQRRTLRPCFICELKCNHKGESQSGVTTDGARASPTSANKKQSRPIF